MTKTFEKLNNKNGLVCEVFECGECGTSAIVPKPIKNGIDCSCGYLLDSQETIRIKLVPLLKLKTIQYDKRNRKHKK